MMGPHDRQSQFAEKSVAKTSLISYMKLSGSEGLTLRRWQSCVERVPLPEFCVRLLKHLDLSRRRDTEAKPALSSKLFIEAPPDMTQTRLRFFLT